MIDETFVRFFLNDFFFAEFLLGDDVISAPVIEKGAISRNIYIPKGSWKDGNTGAVHEGPHWIQNYPAPLDVLPYFIRIK